MDLAEGAPCRHVFWPTAECLTEAKLPERPHSNHHRDELDRWVRATVQPALAYATSLIGDPATAEDLVHDCYGRLLEKSCEYNLPRDGRKLLFKSVTNACINWTQRRPAEAALDQTPEPARLEADPEHDLIYQELEEALEQALGELTVPQRAVVELQAYGHSLVEVADMLEMSHANARTLLHRARKKLTRKLQPFLEEHNS